MWSFLNPALLWWLPLAGLPILIHLFNRRRAVSHPFAAIEFVRKSLEKTRRQFQLKAWLLLILRTLAVLALLLALAGPQPRVTSAAASIVRKSKSVVLLVDRSASMRWKKEGGKRLFDLAREQALAVIRGLEDGDDVCVSLFDDAIRESDGRLRIGKAASERLIRSAQPGYAATKIGPALTHGLALLKDALHDRQEIHLFTDFAHGGWNAEGMPKESDWKAQGDVHVLLHDVQGEAHPRNVAITNVKILRNPGVHGGYEATVSLHNFENQRVQDFPVVLRLGKDEIARVFQDLPSSSVSEVKMIWRLHEEQRSSAESALWGRIAIREDELAVDDEWLFRVNPQSTVNALVIDGDPQPDPFSSETYFLMKALTRDHAEDSSVMATMVTVDEFRSQMLDQADIAILANVRTLSLEQVEALRRLVWRGGGLWITLGSQVEIEHYHQLFRDLLPARLRDFREEDAGIGFESVISTVEGNPIFETFSASDRALFNLPRFKRYVVVEQTLSQGAHILLRFVNGSPALIGKTLGKGRVALLTTTIDRAWNDFPIQTTYLPFIHATMFYLSGSNQKDPLWEARVGDEVEVRVPMGTDRVTVKDPIGGFWQEPVYRVEKDQSGIRFNRTQWPGLYALTWKPGERTAINQEGVIVIRPATIESDVKKIDRAQITQWLPKQILDEEVALENGQAGKQKSSVSLTPALFMVVVAVLCAEAFVIRI